MPGTEKRVSCYLRVMGYAIPGADRLSCGKPEGATDRSALMTMSGTSQVQPAIRLRSRYVKPGTDIPNMAVSAYAAATRSPVLTPRIVLPGGCESYGRSSDCETGEDTVCVG
eukprot:3940643-Rhodomonas_salina.13